MNTLYKAGRSVWCCLQSAEDDLGHSVRVMIKILNNTLISEKVHSKNNWKQNKKIDKEHFFRYMEIQELCPKPCKVVHKILNKALKHEKSTNMNEIFDVAYIKFNFKRKMLNN
uniref:Uncharacterized protein n=1 Tax=Cacopsylla melanoneura TaxID=428564 RepID=A0A8D8LWC7_9HEMI